MKGGETQSIRPGAGPLATFILDLREVTEPSIEDKSISYFQMNFNGGNQTIVETLPYNLINTNDALAAIQSICKDAKRISFYGHSQKVSEAAVCPTDNVFAKVYCVER